jgi:hypothetical protein
MATQITLTSGEHLEVRTTIEELKTALAGGGKVIEVQRDSDGARVFVVAREISSFEVSAAASRREVPLWAFRGTNAPVNSANGEPRVVVVVASGRTREEALAHAERNESHRGYRFQKVTADSGPADSAVEAQAALEGQTTGVA